MRKHVVFESAKAKKERKRKERLRKRIEGMPLRAFTVADLPALLAFAGYERKSPPFLFKPEATILLGKKLKRIKRKKRA